MMNPTDLADMVIMNKLITVTGLSKANTFNNETFIDLDSYCFFYNVMSDLLFANNHYEELWTELDYDIKYWKKIKTEADMEFMYEIVSNIDNVLVGQGISYTETYDTDPVTSKTYMVKSCRRTDIIRDGYREDSEQWECRGGRYKIIVPRLLL